MRRLCVLIVIGVCISAAAQNAPDQQRTVQAVQTMCRGSLITTGAKYEKVQRIVRRLVEATKEDQRHQVFFALTTNSDINAWEVPVQDLDHSVVCIPEAMVDFMGEGDGELAFIIAHESGHAIDDVCKTAAGRLAIARQRGSLGAALGGLTGGDRAAYESSKLSQQRGCEERADELGFRMFVAAGYNPFDAAGAFGRLEMYSGDTSTGILARLASLASDHPMTPDRIKHMRMLLMGR